MMQPSNAMLDIGMGTLYRKYGVLKSAFDCVAAEETIRFCNESLIPLSDC
jgi:hypothetical protein